MNGYHDHHQAMQLVRDHQNRLQRNAGRSRLFREAKRLRTSRRTP